MILDSAAAIQRARDQVGKPDGSGACLANVYKWFGGPAWSSTGPGAGQYNWAIKVWTFAQHKHPGDYYPPAGVPVLYGPVGSPRWRGDANYPCGDIGLSIGGGFAVFTDSPTGNTGIMSISARASQIGRPYLGWTEDLMGYDTTAGQAARAPQPAPTPVVVVVPTIPPTPTVETDMIYVKSDKSKTNYIIGETTVMQVTDSRARTYSAAIPGDTHLFATLSSARCAGLIDDCRQRRDQANLATSKVIVDALHAEDAPSDEVAA